MNRHSASATSGKRASGAARGTVAQGGAGGQGSHGQAAPEGKRERILEAAVRIFASKGFYNAKVSQVAHEAGVADGTIYLYFKSKDDLLISLFEDRMDEVNQNLRTAIAGGGTAVEKLRRVVELHLRLVEENPQLAEVLTVELRQSAKFLKEYRQTKFGEFLKLVAQPIEEGQADGSIRGDLDAPVIARALFGALDELALAWCLRPSGNGSGSREKGKRGKASFELSRVAGQLADLFIEGLVAPRSAPHGAKRKRGEVASETAGKESAGSETEGTE